MRSAIAIAAVGVSLAGCQTGGILGVKVGDDSARTPVTGAAGGAVAQGEKQIERCDRALGTVAVVEDQEAQWYGQLRNDYRLQSTVPLIRLLIQQSNCFVVVERGRAMQNMQQERMLERSGEMRAGSRLGQGQMVAADYTLNPMVTFSSRDTGGVGGAFASLAPLLGQTGQMFGQVGTLAGAVAGNVNLKFREAATTLTLVDNRSGVQIAAAEGAASKTDFDVFGGALSGSGLAGALEGYTNTREGKVIAGAFADAYNRLVRATRSYTAQEVKGGLGTGGTLSVQEAVKPVLEAPKRRTPGR